jgi:hypothetical protein
MKIGQEGKSMIIDWLFNFATGLGIGITMTIIIGVVLLYFFDKKQIHYDFLTEFGDNEL